MNSKKTIPKHIQRMVDEEVKYRDKHGYPDSWLSPITKLKRQMEKQLVQKVGKQLKSL